MIAFVQPFGTNYPGGGARILRALLNADHPPVLSINTAHWTKPILEKTGEIYLPLRPTFGRLERTRFHDSFGLFEGVFRSSFEGRLRRTFRENQIKLIHIIPHAYEILAVSRVASELNIPCFLSVHDDLEYTALGHPLMKQMVAALGEAWRNAKGVFVISEEIGREYCRRYGAREYQIVTDGLISVAEAPLTRPEATLRVYFMGLFHFGYGANLRAVLDALKIVRTQHPDWNISVTCRSERISCGVGPDDVPVTVLPFAAENVLEKDMLSADLLYQPLPFEDDAANFGKFSMSTKLVTYLGSGLPILFHGPQDAAACNMLTRHRAAIICTTLDAETIAKELIEAASNRKTIVNNALQLARSRFMLADQQRRFWEPIVAAL